MLTNDFPFLQPHRLEPGLSGRLHALADDLDRLRDGAGPSEDELAAAPLLSDWRCALTPLGIRLIGTVWGHPRLRAGEIMTSQIWAADPNGRWVRTMSRYYRLGARSPLDAEPAHGSRAADFDGGL